ncbi:hypothetical protein [Marinilactibacillus sp. Marseille-P9653]|uniref:hypothetical protein n=1 Tax=Marinilactibacillus sp. Marseille-P9653 TaxID=2866583 RepID=UPI001CE4A842|nr:hypothetical protein [Marinilactibacillus sp. Marseille-P9653]
MKPFFKSVFILNIVSFLLSIIYLIIPMNSILANGYGILLIATLISNVIASTIGSRYKPLDIIYLLLSSIGFVAVMLLNTVASISPTNESSRSLVSIGMLFLMMILGMIITSKPQLYSVRPVHRAYSLNNQSKKKTKRVLKWILAVIIALCLLVGTFLAFIMVTNRDVGLLQVVLSQYSLFYGFIFLSLTGLLLKVLSINIRSMPGCFYPFSACLYSPF